MIEIEIREGGIVLPELHGEETVGDLDAMISTCAGAAVGGGGDTVTLRPELCAGGIVDFEKNVVRTIGDVGTSRVGEARLVREVGGSEGCGESRRRKRRTRSYEKQSDDRGTKKRNSTKAQACNTLATNNVNMRTGYTVFGCRAPGHIDKLNVMRLESVGE